MKIFAKKFLKRLKKISSYILKYKIRFTYGNCVHSLKRIIIIILTK